MYVYQIVMSYTLNLYLNKAKKKNAVGKEG